ncbi:unnamed protein product [Arctogadus glacialis]
MPLQSVAVGTPLRPARVCQPGPVPACQSSQHAVMMRQKSIAGPSPPSGPEEIAPTTLGPRAPLSRGPVPGGAPPCLRPQYQLHSHPGVQAGWERAGTPQHAAAPLFRRPLKALPSTSARGPALSVREPEAPRRRWAG